mgnify:CR=1 FL=1
MIPGAFAYHRPKSLAEAVGLLADPLKMRVRTYDVSGKPAKRPFHLAAFRD